jgi:hypothetical protein
MVIILIIVILFLKLLQQSFFFQISLMAPENPSSVSHFMNAHTLESISLSCLSMQCSRI